MEVADTYNLVGIATTGWSRYAYPRVQGEPTDACLPELTMAGLLLYNGNWPSDGWARCEQFLEAVGEQDNVRQLRTYCQRLEDARDDAWARVRQLKEHLANLAADVTRSDAGMASFLFDHLKPVVAHVESLTSELAPLLETRIIEQAGQTYGQAWVVALQREVAQIKLMITRDTNQPTRTAV